MGEKEFVIFNDDPDVNYVCDYPEVKIYNWKHRFRNVRTKFNSGITFCKGYAFACVADDDLYKPWTMRTMFEALGDDKFLAVNGFWKRAIVLEKQHWHQQVIGGLYACRMDFFYEMGGYMEWVCELGGKRSSVPVGDRLTRCKITRETTKVAPENFLDRVKETDDYKELKVNKEDGFFTWMRGTTHHGWFCNDETKYVIKERNPEIITIY